MKKILRSPHKVIRWIIAFMWVVIAVFPLWYTFSVVFSPPGVPVTQQFFPSSFRDGLVKVIDVITQENLNIVRASGVTFIFASLQVIGMILVTSLAAYEFALFDFPGKNFLFMIALSSLMMPAAVTLIPLYKIAINFNWMNTYQGLAVPGMASALALFIFRQFMESLPKELIDAAEIDGASHFGIFTRIIFPLSGNAILTVAVWAFVNAWANYIWPLVILTRPEMYSVSLAAAAHVGQRSWSTVDFAMATYLISAIPPIIIYVFLQRYIIQGFSTTGLKG